MENEAQIIYSILEVVKASHLNDDVKIGERVMRSYLHTHRAELLKDYYLEGMVVSDECFQTLYDLDFEFRRKNLFRRPLPGIIRLRDNAGFYFEKNGNSIPVVGSEEFELGLKNIINGSLPKIKTNGHMATLFIGKQVMTSCGPKPSDNEIINDFLDDVEFSQNKNVRVDLVAILRDPDVDPNYDWTQDPFPLPAELFAELKKRILKIEFNIILQVPKDNVTNLNEDEI